MNDKKWIKNSLECQWRKEQVKLLIIVWAGACILSLILMFAIGIDLRELGFIILGLGALVTFLGLMPVGLYYYSQYLKIVKNYDQYDKYEVLLDKPSSSYLYDYAIFYTVSFTTIDGERVTLDTKPIWSSFSKFSIAEYNNKKVDILYDKEHERVIVLGLKKE
jgi:hypothetical protein